MINASKQMNALKVLVTKKAFNPKVFVAFVHFDNALQYLFRTNIRQKAIFNGASSYECGTCPICVNSLH